MSRLSPPNPREPWLDPRTGYVSRYWLRFLNDLFTLSGGSVDRVRLPPVPVSVGPSPFVYEPGSSGLLIVAGGMVTKIEYGRTDQFFSDGSTAGSYSIAGGDKLRITYETAPTVTFIPVN